jgi:hypothetical protein
MFTHRGYNGWITDLSSVGRPDAAWPAIDIDDTLVADYQNTYAFLQHIGINEMTVWGFFAARDWEPDIQATIDSRRADQVCLLLQSAQAHNIKVLSGLGLYSWGFDKIIEQNPHLTRGNPHAMCASLEASWDWQRRVIDFVMGFPLAGVSMQSADQGRCRCDACSCWGDVDYHARINDRAAKYIKANWPDRIVGISNWGMDFQDPKDLSHLVTMTRHADYLIDVNDSLIQRDAAYRRRVAQAISPCTLGSGGTPNVEPPQHWERDRWFLPTLRRTAENLQAFYADGGRAVENYMHLIVNPSDEASIRLAAAVELEPSADWIGLLNDILSEMYAPADDAARAMLCDLFLGAEDAYFDNANHPPLCVVRLEPLVSARVGPPIYIQEPIMDSPRRERYQVELTRLKSLAEQLCERVGNAERMRHVAHCIGRALDDLASVEQPGRDESNKRGNSTWQ